MASGFRPKKALAITFSVGNPPMLRSLCAVVYAIAFMCAWATLLRALGPRPRRAPSGRWRQKVLRPSFDAAR
jgi:hypothetical protein